MLHAVLASARGYAPQYGNRLANHLPMAAAALVRMGASAAQLQRFADGYVARLQPRAAAGEEFERYATGFTAALTELGADAVLRTWIPRLLPGLAASAYHCLIRTAYAVESGYLPELADALAYWRSAYVEPGLPPRAASQDPGAVVEDVLAAFGAGRPYTGIILDKMLAAAHDPFFASGAPLPNGLTLDALRAVVLGLYRQCEDFTLLHTVTATHALRVLLPFSGGAQAACAHLWQAHLLALATVARTVAQQRGPDAPAPCAGWTELLAQACASADDHTIKLVYTAWEEGKLHDEPAYCAVAARRLSLS